MTHIVFDDTLFDGADLKLGPGYPLNVVHMDVLEEAGRVYSSLLDSEPEILVPPYPPRNLKEWQQLIGTQLVDFDQSRYVAFLNPKRKQCVLLAREPGSTFPLAMKANKVLNLSNRLIETLRVAPQGDGFIRQDEKH